MTPYILFLMIIGSYNFPVSITSARFGSEAACESAATNLKRQYGGLDGIYSVTTTCAPEFPLAKSNDH